MMADGTPEGEILEVAPVTTVRVNRETRNLIDRCGRLLSELPEPQRSNLRFVLCATGGAVPAPGAKIPAGEVIHYALAALEANLDPQARAQREAAEMAYQNYLEHLRNAHKVRDGVARDADGNPIPDRISDGE
ncbi:MAG: hypothetical protein OXI69_13855 [Acidobacteriota bacterium]|nr:hypothetical protein [Acidobacteriota bacterium]